MGKRKSTPNPKYLDGVSTPTRKSSRKNKKQQKRSTPVTTPRVTRRTQKEKEIADPPSDDQAQKEDTTQEVTDQTKDPSTAVVQEQQPTSNSATQFSELGKIITEALTSYFAKNPGAPPFQVIEKPPPSIEPTTDLANSPSPPRIVSTPVEVTKLLPSESTYSDGSTQSLSGPAKSPVGTQSLSGTDKNSVNGTQPLAGANQPIIYQATAFADTNKPSLLEAAPLPLGIPSGVLAPPAPQNTISKSPTSLSLGVPPEVKKKIFQNEYVDFGIFLSSKLSQPNEYTIKLSPSNSNAPLTLVPASQPRKISNLDQWIRAFLIFKSVHLERFPEDAIPLTVYEANIRQLAAEGANWLYYDEHFRLARQTSCSPWDRFDSELWVRAHTSVVKPNQSFNGRQSYGRSSIPISQLPKGFCFNFLQGRHCDFQCGFKHHCPNCGGKHQLSKCYSNNNNPNSNNNRNRRPDGNKSTASNQSGHLTNNAKSK